MEFCDAVPESDREWTNSLGSRCSDVLDKLQELLPNFLVPAVLVDSILVLRHGCPVTWRGLLRVVLIGYLAHFES